MTASTASAATAMFTSMALRAAEDMGDSTWSAPCSFERGLPTPIRTRC